MPLLEAKHVTLDATPQVEQPAGFLRASALGLQPDALYDEALRGIVAAVEEHLAIFGIAMDSTASRHSLAARALARHYAAELVLSHADTGRVTDQTGASVALTSSDLNHWQRMKDDGIARADRLLGDGGPAKSGVYFPGVKLRSDDASS